MLDANYLRHVKALGKYVYMYDQAAAARVTQLDILAKTVDQVATGSSADNTAVLALASRLSAWDVAIGGGVDALKALMKQLVDDYMHTTACLATFVSETVNAGMSAAALIQALADEMTTDGKSFDVDGSTGFANFFKTEYDVTMPTSGSPTYADNTYVVGTIV